MEYNYQQAYMTGSTDISPYGIIRLPDYATVPNDPDNTDWQAYQEWLAQGNTPISPEGN